ncbi:MAG: efflux RND transporter periplasmic adaptor subunit [Bacteroidota bacterium]
MTYKILIINLLLLLMMGCKTEYAGQETQAESSNAPVPVKMVRIAPSTEPIPIEAGGTIGAKEEVRLSFKIGGIVEGIYAEEGQYVRKGKVLARLKTTEIDAEVMKAQQAKDKALRDLERIEKLYVDSATTLENVQNLRTALEVAESDLEIASFNQSYAVITAPVSGRVVKRFAERGELIGAGQPLFQLVGEGQRSYVLRIGVADRDILRLATGDKAEVRLDAYLGDAIPASVTELAAAADPRTGTFEVELTLEPGKRTIRNGFIGRATIFPSRQPAYVKLPLDALVEGNGQLVKVFIPGPEGTATSKEVRVIQVLDNSFAIPAADLADIDQVITAGAAYLSEGQQFIVSK